MTMTTMVTYQRKYGVRLVASDISVVAYPTELVLDSKPIQRTVTFRRGRVETCRIHAELQA